MLEFEPKDHQAAAPGPLNKTHNALLCKKYRCVIWGKGEGKGDCCKHANHYKYTINKKIKK